MVYSEGKELKMNSIESKYACVRVRVYIYVCVCSVYAGGCVCVP